MFYYFIVWDFCHFPEKKLKKEKFKNILLTKIFKNIFIKKKILTKISIQKLYFLSGYNDIQHNISPAVLQVQKGF